MFFIDAAKAVVSGILPCKTEPNGEILSIFLIPPVIFLQKSDYRIKNPSQCRFLLCPDFTAFLRIILSFRPDACNAFHFYEGNKRHPEQLPYPIDYNTKGHKIILERLRPITHEKENLIYHF